MSKLNRKRTILAKIESVYGTDATPSGSDAMLVRNLNVTPIDAETVSRDLIRPYLGNSDTLLAQTSVKLDFEIELAGAGIPGAAPAWAPLLKACGFSQTLNTAAVTITRSSSTATATLAAHGFAVGDTVTISGASESEYNGDQRITAVTTNTFDFEVSGTPTTPATGSPVVGRTAVYTPVSSSFDSLSIYFALDGIRQKILGARGSVEFGINVKQIPVMKFSFIGLYSALTDTSDPTPDFSSFQIPKVANTSNTTSFSLHSYSGYLESMSLNIANQVEYVTRIGYEAVNIIDRKPAGTFVMELPTIAAKDYFTIAKNGTTGAMTITHGTASGNIVKLDAPRVSIQNPSYQDSQGVAMISVPFVATPDSGNDELTITVK